MKKILSLLLIFAILFSLTSCAKVKKLLGRGAQQVFSYPIEQMPETLDPQIASTAAELTIIENCMEGLVRVNAEGKAVPAVAESWNVSADGLKYTFNLRHDATWYIDEDFDEFIGANFDKSIKARDFVFAISRAVKKSTNAPDFQSVSLIKNAVKIHDSGTNNTSSLGVKALDDYTLQITLESPNSSFIISLASAVFMPCDKEFFDLCSGRYGRQLKYFVSNGGFYLRNWVEKSLTISKNEEYKGANVAKGDSVTLYFDENATENFKNDNYDAIPVGEDYIGEAIADENITVQQYDDTVWAIAVNCKSTFGSSKNFRQALMQCIKADELTYPDWADKAQGIVPNICTSGGKTYRDSAKTAKYLPYNPTVAAKKYFSALTALYKDEAAEKGSLINVYTIASFDQTAKQIVQMWQRNLGTGFQAKINMVSFEELDEAVKNGAYDVAIFPFSADTQDSLVFLNKFKTKDNVLNFTNSAFNKILSSKTNELKKAKSAENALLATGAVMPLVTSNSYYAQRKNVSGIYFYAFGGKVNFLDAVRAD